jgi:hypothetical protein
MGSLGRCGVICGEISTLHRLPEVSYQSHLAQSLTLFLREKVLKPLNLAGRHDDIERSLIVQKSAAEPSCFEFGYELALTKLNMPHEVGSTG